MNITIQNVNIFISSSEILDELKSSDGLLDIRNLIDNAGRTAKDSIEQIHPDWPRIDAMDDINESEALKVKEPKTPPQWQKLNQDRNQN